MRRSTPAAGRGTCCRLSRRCSNQNGATLTDATPSTACRDSHCCGDYTVVAGPPAPAPRSSAPLRRGQGPRQGARTLCDRGRQGDRRTDPQRAVVSGDTAARQTLASRSCASMSMRSPANLHAILPGRQQTLERSRRAGKGSSHRGAMVPVGLVRVVPMQRVNAVLVGHPAALPRQARRCIGSTSRAEDTTARAWHVYYVQNGQSATWKTCCSGPSPRATCRRSAAPGPPRPGPKPPRRWQALRGNGPGGGGGGRTGSRAGAPAAPVG